MPTFSTLIIFLLYIGDTLLYAYIPPASISKFCISVCVDRFYLVIVHIITFICKLMKIEIRFTVQMQFDIRAYFLLREAR